MDINTCMNYIDENGVSTTFYPVTRKNNVIGLEQDIVNITSDINSISSELLAINEAVNGKVDKITGKGLSTKDFTAEYKKALDDLDENLALKANASAVDSLVNRVSTVETTINSTIDYVTPEMYPGTDDEKFEAMFADVKSKNIKIDGVYTLTENHVSRYCENIFGTGKIINHTQSSDVNFMLEFTALKQINGITFDSDNVSLGALNVHDVDSIDVTNCSFKNYNETVKRSDYTEGSQLLVKNVGRLSVTGCTFKDNGYNAGTEPSKLNRCITFSGTADSCFVSSCYFERVNQAIVTGGQAENVLIRDNCFRNVSDNVLYHLSSGIAFFTDNKCESCSDECVVALNAVINNNLIINQSNYVFSQNGNDSEIVQLKNNVIMKTTGGNDFNILRARNANYKCKLMQIVGNNFVSDLTCNPYMFNGFNVENMIITDNLFNVKIGSSGTIFNGASERLTVSRNTVIENDNITDNIQFVNAPTAHKFIFDSNYISTNVRPINDITRLENSRVLKVVNKWWFGNDEVPNIIYGHEPPSVSGDMITKNGTLYINLEAEGNDPIISIYHNSEWKTVV